MQSGQRRFVWTYHAVQVRPFRLQPLAGLYAFLYAHAGKKLLFMGGELGQWNEWNSARSLDWHLLVIYLKPEPRSTN